MAWSPATPAPSTSPLAGGVVPEAAIIMGKSFPSVSAAMTAALYPASDAMDDRTSMLCARAMRGMASRLKLVTPASAIDVTAA